MKPLPKDNEDVDITVYGNDVDIDMSQPRSKSKSKSRSTKGKKQQSVAEFKQAIAEPKTEQTNQTVDELVISEDKKSEVDTIDVAQHKKTESLEVHTGDIETNVIETVSITQDACNEDNTIKLQNENIVLFMKYITDPLLTNEISIKLDDKTKQCLMFILETYPNELDGFDKLIKVIIDDCKIDIEDLSDIIKLCSKIHGLVSKTKLDFKTAIECSRMILKFTIRVLIVEKKIKMEHNQIDGFLKGFDNFIDVCLDMLIESKNLEKGCSSFFKKLLCKKT